MRTPVGDGGGHPRSGCRPRPRHRGPRGMAHARAAQAGQRRSTCEAWQPARGPRRRGRGTTRPSPCGGTGCRPLELDAPGTAVASSSWAGSRTTSRDRSAPVLAAYVHRGTPRPTMPRRGVMSRRRHGRRPRCCRVERPRCRSGRSHPLRSPAASSRALSSIMPGMSAIRAACAEERRRRQIEGRPTVKRFPCGCTAASTLGVRG
jgi:hypothetical protein